MHDRLGRDRTDALLLVAVLVALMWILEVIDQSGLGALDGYGIHPRDVDRLSGIVSAPFLHVGFGHLLANTAPFVAMGAVIALGGLVRIATVTLVVVITSGLGTWLVAPAGTLHLGASGIVFGYAAYLVARGAYSRRLSELAVGVVLVVLWGVGLLRGLLPQDGISWQAHLFGAVGGVAAAALLAARRPQGARKLVG